MVDFTDVSTKEIAAGAKGAGSSPIVDNTLKDIFSTAGDVLEAGVTLVDEGNKREITRQVNENFDKANSLFGVDAAADVADGLPLEVTKGKAELESMNNAFKQGNLRESNYYGMLHAKVRKLRAQFPGYRDEIDSIVSGITGTKPANALRRALISEFNDELRREDAAKTADMKFIEKSLGDGHITMEQVDAAKGDMGVIKSIALNNMAKDADIKRRKASIELDNATLTNQDKVLKRTQDKTELLAGNEISFGLSKAISSGITSETGEVGGAAIVTMITDAQKDGVISPQEMQSIRTNFSQLKLSADALIQNTLSQPVYQNLTISQKKKIKEDQLASLDIIEESIFDDKKGIAQWTVAQLEDQNNSDKSNFLRQYPTGRLIKQLRDIGGSDLLNTFLGSGTFKHDELATAGTGFISMIGGDKGARVTINDMIEAGATAPTIKKTLEGARKVIFEGTEIQKLKAITNLYESGSDGLINDIAKQDRKALFDLMMSPAVTEEVKRLRTKNPEIWERYKDTAQRQFGVLYKQATDNINAMPNGVLSGTSVEFNEETNRFEVSATENVGGDLQAVNQDNLQVVTQRYSMLNSLLSTFKPILETEGNVNDGIRKLLVQHGVGTDGATVEPRPIQKFISEGNTQDIDKFIQDQETEEKGLSIRDKLVSDLNLPSFVAAGIVGNLAHESGGFKTLQEINPLVKGSRGGFGWAQWTGPRRRQFESWSEKRGLDPSSDEANYGFLIHELTNTGESKVLEKLQSASTPEEAAEIFSNIFLRPGIPHLESRKKFARQFS